MVDVLSFKSLKHSKSLVVLMILSTIAVVTMLSWTKSFLAYNESRPGWHLYDPIINWIVPVKLCTPIFIATYSCIVIGLLCCMTSPKKIIRVNLTIFSLLIYRIICMYLVPLEPPSGIIPLEDWLLMNTTYSNKLMIKDLFFSGHTASVATLVYLVEHKVLSRFLLFMSVVIGTMLIVQHVHYTVDVLAAYVFAHVSFRSGSWLSQLSLLYIRFILNKKPQLA